MKLETACPYCGHRHMSEFYDLDEINCEYERGAECPECAKDYLCTLTVMVDVEESEFEDE